MSKQVQEKDLAKSAEELLGAATELVKSQICTGSQPKVSHPSSSTEELQFGDSVANGTDYKPGKMKLQDDKLRKALLDKIQKGGTLTDVEKMLVSSVFETLSKGDVEEEEDGEEEEAKSLAGKLGKSLKDNEQTAINAAPALRAFAEEICKGYDLLAKEVADMRKSFAKAAATIDRNVAGKVDAYARAYDEFFAKHAQVTVDIAKSVNEYLGTPSRGVRSETQAPAREDVAPATPAHFQKAQLANAMTDALIAGKAGEFGLTEEQLSKAILSLESTDLVDPEVAGKFVTK